MQRSSKKHSLLGQTFLHKAGSLPGVLLLFQLALVFLFLLLLPFITLGVQAQPAPPAGGPTSPQGQFYTLQHIYDRLATGATDDKPTTFTGPEPGAISSNSPSINDIMAILPAVDDTNCASPSDVLESKTFFSLCSSSWGAQTGTASVVTPAPPELMNTGQDTCYDVDGNVITCAGTGQDGEYQLGATTSPRFTDNGDGTVTDNLTGLIWLRNANCFSTRSWQNALNDANGLASGSCGLSDGSVAGDWRLPNTRELESLIDVQNSSPTLPNGHGFTNITTMLFWSSNTLTSPTSRAWYVTFTVGQVDHFPKDWSTSFTVWPVR